MIKQKDRLAAENWFFDGEVGTSSETICRAFLGREQRRHDATPSDCDDMARCRLLLEKLTPEGQEIALRAVSLRFADWTPLVREWPSLCASMDRECPGWRKRGNRYGKETGKLLGVLRVEGLRLRFPKAQITTYEDGTLSSMFSGGAPNTIVMHVDGE